MDILKPARDEIKTLEKTVADATARLQDLRAFVEAGARLYGLTSINSAPTTPTTSFKKTETSRAKPAQNKADQIVAVVEAALSGGQHAPSKELAEILKQNHIDLGTDPISNLSAYLSKSGRFVSERAKGGWALKQQPHKEEPPRGVDAPAGA